VLRGDALVAEVLAELVYALEAAHEQALEIQLCGDPQVEVAIELVVVGRERPRQGAAVERLQHGGLDLDEALAVEIGAHRRDDPGPVGEQIARLLAGHQVQLAAAVARLHVAQPVVLVGGAAQRLCEQLECVHPQRQLPVAAAQHRPVHADQIAHVQRREPLEPLRAEHVEAGVQLDLPGPVYEVEEGRLAGPAPCQDPSGHAV